MFSGGLRFQGPDVELFWSEFLLSFIFRETVLKPSDQASLWTLPRVSELPQPKTVQQGIVTLSSGHKPRDLDALKLKPPQFAVLFYFVLHSFICLLGEGKSIHSSHHRGPKSSSPQAPW